MKLSACVMFVVVALGSARFASAAGEAGDPPPTASEIMYEAFEYEWNAQDLLDDGDYEGALAAAEQGSAMFMDAASAATEEGNPDLADAAWGEMRSCDEIADLARPGIIPDPVVD